MAHGAPTAWPRTVVFDVGNVLVRWDPEAVCREQLRDPALAARVSQQTFAHDDWQRLDEGVMEEEEANRRFVERTGLPIEDVRRLMLAAKASLVPIPESIALLDELHDAGVHLYALTNMARGTFEFLRPRQHYWNRFRGVVVSAYLRTMKPRRDIFERLIATYRLDPPNTVFLDDNAANVEGARSAGLRSLCFVDAAQAREELQQLAAELR